MRSSRGQQEIRRNVERDRVRFVRGVLTLRVLGVVLGAALFLSLGASGASAVIARIGTHGYGVTPIKGVSARSIAGAYRAPGSGAAPQPPAAKNYDGAPSGGGPLKYLGGPVMHSNSAHVIYWDPGKEFTATTKAVIGGFFTAVAHDSGLASNVFAIGAQYTDTTGNAAYSSTFAGERVDEHAYPSTGNCAVPKTAFADLGPPYTKCLTDGQLRTELSAYITANALPKGPSQLYFLLTPHKVVTCLGVGECSNNLFCAYHSYIAPSTANEIIYSEIPFSLLDSGNAKRCQDDGQALIQQPNPDNAGAKDTETRFADVALKYISHEFIEATTDPLVNEKTAWVDVHGLEIGDKCNGIQGDGTGIGYDANSFLPTLGGSAENGNLFNQSINEARFYLQSEWDNAAAACRMTPLAIGNATFTHSPDSQAEGSPVTFTASADDPYGNLAVTWSFGDGTTAAGISTSHTFHAPGLYTVTMTARDELTGSTAAPVEQTIAVTAASGVPPEAPTPVVPAPAAPPSTPALPAVVQGAPSPPPAQSQSPLAPLLAPAPDSRFRILKSLVRLPAGSIKFTQAVADPGTVTWLLSFPNGKFGVFAASDCQKGSTRLSGRCRPSRIVFASGSAAIAGAGNASFTARPTPSGLRALRNALRQNRGIPVTATLTFQSSRGGSPVTHTELIFVQSKRK